MESRRRGTDFIKTPCVNATTDVKESSYVEVNNLRPVNTSPGFRWSPGEKFLPHVSSISFLLQTSGLGSSRVSSRSSRDLDGSSLKRQRVYVLVLPT